LHYLPSINQSTNRQKITYNIFENKPSYLSQPEWQLAMRETIIENPNSPNRSEAVVTLSMNAAHIPPFSTMLRISSSTNFPSIAPSYYREHRQLVTATKHGGVAGNPNA
jgi:hypothetical protein